MWIALANVPDIDKRDLSSLRYVASGGAPLPVEVAERFLKLTGHKLGGGWGMTETSPAGTACRGSGRARPAQSACRCPASPCEIVALDDPRRVLGPNEKGEIRIKGPNVTKGYWNAPQETAAAFVDGYLLTGDIGTMDEDGYFYLVDRKKDMIVSGGFNVYPRTIEEAIYEHPAVAAVSVIGVPDSYRGEAAKAFVQLKPGATALHAGGAARLSCRQARQGTRCPRSWNSATRCRRRRRQAVEERTDRGGAAKQTVQAAAE